MYICIANSLSVSIHYKIVKDKKTINSIGIVHTRYIASGKSER